MANRAKRVSVREVFKSTAWTIISIIEDDRQYRIEAKRNEPIKDQLNHFVGYGSKVYAEQLAETFYEKNIHNIVKE